MFCVQEPDGAERGQQNVNQGESSPNSSSEWCDAESSPPPQLGICAKNVPATSEARQSHVNNTLNSTCSEKTNNTNMGDDADTAESELTMECHQPGQSEREGVGSKSSQQAGGKVGKMEEEAAFDHMEKTTENVMAWITEVCVPFT